jgi:hypothetical protein
MNRHIKTHGLSPASLQSHKDEYQVKFEEKPEYPTPPPISDQLAQHINLNEPKTIKKWVPSSLCAAGMKNAGKLLYAIVDDGSVGGDSGESVMSDGDDEEDEEDEDTIKLLQPYLRSGGGSLLLPVSAMRTGQGDERGASRSSGEGEFPYGIDVRFCFTLFMMWALVDCW